MRTVTIASCGNDDVHHWNCTGVRAGLRATCRSKRSAPVVAEARFERPLQFPEPSTARSRAYHARPGATRTSTVSAAPAARGGANPDSLSCAKKSESEVGCDALLTS